jgi:hypothetical protein
MINMVMDKIINLGVALKSFSVRDLSLGYASDMQDNDTLID